MRKSIGLMILAGALVTAPATVSLADDDVGCGFGTMVFEGKTGTGWKVLAAILNGSFGNQTFGVSFGTLGCDTGGTITAQERVHVFASASFDRLAVDMAMGQGESLDAFATLLDVPEADRPALYTLARESYLALYPSDETTSGEMLSTLFELMQQDATLAPYALS